ncbi:hypothetical protein BSAF29S_04327 [Bacillus safensis subsp. safensis]
MMLARSATYEFDEGVDELLRIINGGDHPKGTKGYDGQNFPLVCANCEYKDTGKPLLPAYEIMDVEGIPVAFIGVVTKVSRRNGDARRD